MATIKELIEKAGQVAVILLKFLDWGGGKHLGQTRR